MTNRVGAEKRESKLNLTQGGKIHISKSITRVVWDVNFSGEDTFSSYHREGDDVGKNLIYTARETKMMKIENFLH